MWTIFYSSSFWLFKISVQTFCSLDDIRIIITRFTFNYLMIMVVFLGACYFSLYKLPKHKTISSTWCRICLLYEMCINWLLSYLLFNQPYYRTMHNNFKYYNVLFLQFFSYLIFNYYVSLMVPINNSFSYLCPPPYNG